MGLDNGFVCRGISVNDIPDWVNLSGGYNQNNEEVEIVYFRKCWGIRDEILKLLHSNKEDGYVDVDSEDIISIVKILMKYLDEVYYEDHADSIWSYEEARNNIQKSIFNLLWLKMYMDEHPKVTCFFYDCY